MHNATENSSGELRQEAGRVKKHDRGHHKSETAFSPLSLRSNFRWVFFSQIVYLASQWAILSALTKLSDPMTVGLFGLALAITAPANFFLGLGLRQAQASDINDQYRFQQYLGLISISSVVLVITCTAGTAIFNTGASAIAIVGLYALAKAIEMHNVTTYGLFQKYERMDLTARSTITRGIGALCLFLAIFTLVGTNDAKALAWGIVGICISWLTVLLVHDLPTARRLLTAHHAANPMPHGVPRVRSSIRPTWRPSMLLPLFWHSLPLGFSALLIALQLNIPRYFIELRMGGEALGYFTPVIFILSAGSQFINPLTRAATPRLARHFSSGRLRAFVKLVAGLVAIASGCGAAAFLIALFFGGEILAFIYAPEYAAMQPLFALLMAAGILRFAASAIQTATVAARRFRTQLVQQICVAMASFVASYFLVGGDGLISAGWAVLAAATMHFLIVLTGVALSIRHAVAEATDRS